jgi:4-oxalmesaconate hydratase
MLVRKIGPDNVLFGSEMFGTAKTRDSATDRFFDDILGDLDGLGLAASDLTKILSGNALRLFPRAAAHLGAAHVQ